jgi:hypothetical protein
MTVILTVVYTKGLGDYGGIVIGGILGLDVFFLGFISGASMILLGLWPLLCFQAFRLTCGFTGRHFYWNFYIAFIYRLSLDVARKTFRANN